MEVIRFFLNHSTPDPPPPPLPRAQLVGDGEQRLGTESEARALSKALTRLVEPHHFLFPLVRAHCVLKPFLLLSKQAPRGCFRVCLEDLSELWAQSFGRFVKKAGPSPWIHLFSSQ